MNYFKKIVDWVVKSYDPIFEKKKPKKRVFIIKGKKYYLKKRIKNASSKQKRR